MQAGSFYLGPWLVETAAHRLSRQQDSRRISPKAMIVLAKLAEMRGGVVSRGELLEAAWPDVVVGEEVLTHAIAELRRKLGDDSRRPRFVETVHKSGYRLVAQVKDIGRDSWALAADHEPAVAVLPFVNLSGYQEFDELALSATSETLNSLTGMTGLRVVCLDSDLFGTRPVTRHGPIQPIDAHIEGSIAGTPPCPQVNVRIVDRRSGSYLWSKTFYGEGDVRGLSGQIAPEIGSAIDSHVVGHGHRPKAWASVNPESYVTHLRANELFYHGGRENVHTARELFSQAAEIDPTFALPQAGLAKCLAFLHVYYEPRGSHLPRAIEIAEATVKAHRQFAMAHATLGLVLSLSSQFEMAARCFGSAIRLGSDAFEPHYLFGRACFAEGKFTMAAAMFERAAQLRNEDFHASILAAKAYRALGDEERARRACLRSMHRLENYLGSYPGDLRATCDKACCLVELGYIDQALDCAAPISESEDPLSYYLVGSLARAGQAQAALDCLERITDAGWSHVDWLRRDPDLESLREERRFQRIERSLQLH